MSEQEAFFAMLDSCEAFLERALAGGGIAIVHCAEDMSRAAALLLGFVMKAERLPLQHAQRHLLARSSVAPDAAALAHLQVWETTLRTQGMSGERTDGNGATQKKKKQQSWEKRVVDHVQFRSRIFGQILGKHERCYHTGLCSLVTVIRE